SGVLPKPARPATVPKSFAPNVVVAIDLFELPAWNGEGTDRYLNAVCLGTNFQLVEKVRSKQPGAVWAALARGWARVLGFPQIILLDQGTEFLGEFRQNAHDMGVLVHTIGARAPFQNGRCERHGALFKTMMQKAVWSCPPTSSDDFKLLLREVESAKNRLSDRSGFSPAQRMLGETPRTTGELLADEMVDVVLKGVSGEMEKRLQAKRAAQKAFAEVNTSQAVRKAMRARARTQRTFRPGDIIFVWRSWKAQGVKKQAWVGPGVVVLPDGPNAYVNVKGRLWRVANEHLREGTSEEMRGIEAVHQVFDELKERFKRKTLGTPFVPKEKPEGYHANGWTIQSHRRQTYNFQTGNRNRRPVQGLTVTVGSCWRTKEACKEVRAKPGKYDAEVTAREFEFHSEPAVFAAKKSTDEINEKDIPTGEWLLRRPTSRVHAIGLLPEQLVEVVCGVYGLVDGPVHWRQTLKKFIIEELHYRQSKLDPTVFLLSHEGKLEGIIVIEIDDVLAFGYELHDAALARLRQKFKFGKFKKLQELTDGTTFNGRRIRQTAEFQLLVDMEKYVQERLFPMKLEKGRRSQPEAEATPEERQKARAVIGALAWAAKEARPDAAAAASMMASRLPKAKGATAVIAFDKKLLTGERAQCSLIWWKSGKLRRKVGSTLAAEAQALNKGLGDLLWAKAIYAELMDPQFDLETFKQDVKSKADVVLRKADADQVLRDSLSVIDAKSLYDNLMQEGNQPQDKFTALDVAIAREKIDGLGVQLRWVEHQSMVVDSLTKISANKDALFDLLRSGTFRLEAEGELLEDRLLRRQEGRVKPR
ncbi:Kcnh5, partial [Symbiodinium necroappetens]